MRAIVLAGGRGTRLRPYTAVLPKPLLPIGDGPVLEIVVQQLEAAGFDHITVATGYMAELIETVLNHRRSAHLSATATIDFVRENDPLGTVGPLAYIEDLEDPFLVMNGDVLTDLDYAKLIHEHLSSGAALTIASTTRHIQVTLGVLECFDARDDRRLTGYVEKPEMTYDVSMGIYCFSQRALAYIVPGEHLDLPDLVHRLIAESELVRKWRSDAYWVDLGRREDYEQAISEFDQMRDRLLPPGSELAMLADDGGALAAAD
jgi:NDP-mannose synthase